MSAGAGGGAAIAARKRKKDLAGGSLVERAVPMVSAVSRAVLEKALLGLLDSQTVSTACKEEVRTGERPAPAPCHLRSLRWRVQIVADLRGPLCRL